MQKEQEVIALERVGCVAGGCSWERGGPGPPQPPA